MSGSLLESRTPQCHNRTVIPQTDTLIETEPISIEEPANVARQKTEVSLLDITVVLVQRKRFIARFVLGAMLLSVVVSLILPVRYEGNVTLMPPSQNSSLSSALLGQMGA